MFYYSPQVVVVVVVVVSLPCSVFCSLHGSPQTCLSWIPWLESGDLFGPLESKSFSKEKGNKNEPKIKTIGNSNLTYLKLEQVILRNLTLITVKS